MGGRGGGSNSNVPRWLAMFVSFLCFLPRPLHGLAMKLDCSPSWSTLGLYEQSLRACTLRTLLSWLGLLLDFGSTHTKGGQVMFCPRPLHQLRSQVFSEGAACLRMRALVAPLAYAAIAIPESALGVQAYLRPDRSHNLKTPLPLPP